MVTWSRVVYTGENTDGYFQIEQSVGCVVLRASSRFSIGCDSSRFGSVQLGDVAVSQNAIYSPEAKRSSAI